MLCDDFNSDFSEISVKLLTPLHILQLKDLSATYRNEKLSFKNSQLIRDKRYIRKNRLNSILPVYAFSYLLFIFIFSVYNIIYVLQMDDC